MNYWDRVQKNWSWMWTYSPILLSNKVQKIRLRTTTSSFPMLDLSNKVHKIRIRTTTSLFPPLADLPTFILIILQCLWTFIFIKYDLKKGTSYDVNIVVGILAGTLGFILPLQLNTALNKNAQCLNNYNACTGDLYALCWDIVAFYSEGDKAMKDINIRRSFNIIGAMPALIKHTFRGTIDLHSATTIQTVSRNNPKLNSTEGGHEVCTMFEKLNGVGMTEVDICFYKLLDYIKDLTRNEQDKTRTFLVKSWERAYGSWGTMSNLNAYAPPTIFTYVMNAALTLYSILLPFTLAEQGYHAIWMVAIIGYFFLGLNIAGKKVANAFAEDAIGYQTVTGSQKTASVAIQQIYDTIVDVVSDDKLVFGRVGIGRVIHTNR